MRIRIFILLALISLFAACGGGGDSVSTVAPPSLPVVSVSGTSITESDSGVVSAAFTMSLDSASNQLTSVEYNAADNTAVDGEDYATVFGTVEFQPGETSKTVQVNVTGDLLDEADETFFMRIHSGSGVTIGTREAEGVIVDNDPPSAMTIRNPNFQSTLDDFGLERPFEGDSGTSIVRIPIQVGISGREITFDYFPENLTAVGSEDFTVVTTGATIPAGQTTFFAEVEVNGDTAHEPDELFRLVTTNGENVVTAEALIGIFNDDGPPVTELLPDVSPFLADYLNIAQLAVSQSGDVIVYWQATTVASTLVLFDRVNGSSQVICSDSCENQVALSPDGNFVVFATSAALVPNDLNNQIDVYVLDRATGIRDRISDRPDGSDLFVIESGAQVSDDGRWVAYRSRNSADLSERVSFPQVFVKDRVTRDVIPISFLQTGEPLDRGAELFGISNDGSLVLYAGDQLFLRDVAANTVTVISDVPNENIVEVTFASMSSDGNLIAFSITADSGPKSYLLNRSVGTLELIDYALSAEPSQTSRALLTRSGLFMTFLGTQTIQTAPLVPVAYRRNLGTGETVQVVRQYSSAEPDSFYFTGPATVSGDGLWAVYVTKLNSVAPVIHVRGPFDP